MISKSVIDKKHDRIITNEIKILKSLVNAMIYRKKMIYHRITQILLKFMNSIKMMNIYT